MLNKGNLQKARVRGIIAFYAEIGEPVIFRKIHIHNFFHNAWKSIGQCPLERARGSNTTKYMKLMASDFGYEFAHDGRTKGGNYINPRLVKIGYGG